MRRNLNAADRLFRLVLALTLFPLGFVLDGDARLLGLLGVLPLVAAVLGWSPIYALLRVGAARPPERVRHAALPDGQAATMS